MKHYYIDTYGMVILPFKWDLGLGDSIGRTVRYSIAKDDDSFLDALSLCITPRGIYRHPSLIGDKPNTMSRDHYVNMICGMLYFKQKTLAKKVIKSTKWKLSDRFNKTPDLWLWERAVLGVPFFSTLYYMVSIPLALVYGFWNFVLSKIGGFSKEYTNTAYSIMYPIKVSKWQMLLRKLFFPTYALSWSLFMNYVLKSSPGKRILMRLYTPMIGQANTHLKLLAGIKVPLSEIDLYVPMRSGRYSTYLNERNNRFCVQLDTQNWEDTFWPDKEILYKLYKRNLN